MNPILIGLPAVALAYLAGEKKSRQIAEACSIGNIDEDLRRWREEWARYEARRSEITTLTATTYRDVPSVMEPIRPRSNVFVRLWKRTIGALRFFTR